MNAVKIYLCCVTEPRMKPIFSLLLLFIFFYGGLAQDSLVRYTDLTFSSNQEKEAFDHFKRHDINLFKLFMSNGKLLTEKKVDEYEQGFSNYIADLKFEKAPGKKLDKQIKALNDQLEKKYLLKYVDGSNFEEIFYSGKYNSFSAAALYALAFDGLKIPYTIKEDQQQTYLLVYPLQEKIILRTAPDGIGVGTFSREFKETFVEKLKEQKVITEKESLSRPTDDLFDEFYFGKGNDLTMLNLAGLIYIQEGLFTWRDNKYADAFKQFEKSYFLYPSYRTSYLLLSCGSEFLSKYSKRDSVHAQLLSKLSRYKALGITNESIVGEFAIASQRILVESGNEDQYRQYYRVLTRGVDDITLNKEITYMYNYERGRHQFNRGYYQEALPFFEAAMEQKPNDSDLQSLFLVSLGQAYQSKSNLEFLKAVECYGTDFPGLNTNNKFTSVQAVVYLIEFYRSFDAGKIADGEKYKKLFEAYTTKYPGVTLNSVAVGKAYSSAAIYYFRKGVKSKAKQYIEEGLKYAPNSYELQSRKEMIH
jgi:tetratricopeptide (TPR) repeat protein